jgi:signal transduction histidine kinase
MRGWIHRRLTPRHKFLVVAFVCVLVVTLVACAVGAELLTHYLLTYDAALVGDLARLLVTRSIPIAYFSHGASADPSEYDGVFREIVASADVVRVVLYDVEGRVLWSDDRRLIGQRFLDNQDRETALRGEIAAEIVRPRKEQLQGTLRDFQRLEEIYVPVRYARSEPVIGVLEIYRNAPRFFDTLDRGLALVWILGGGGGLTLYATLLAVARAGVIEAVPLRRRPRGARHLDRGSQGLSPDSPPSGREAVPRIDDTLEAEAARIAQEVHDEAGQFLAAAQLALANAAQGLGPEVRDRLGSVSEALADLEEALRRLVLGLRPTMLDEMGLVPALRFVAQGVSKRTGLLVTVEGSTEGRLPRMVEMVLYRTGQEALTNVVKHAQARRVWIHVARQRRLARCSIRDDGAGFAVNGTTTATLARGLGLRGIRNRVGALGGTVWVKSAPGQGTELVVSIPLAR